MEMLKNLTPMKTIAQVEREDSKTVNFGEVYMGINPADYNQDDKEYSV
jgi:hypothetical protein